MKALSLLAAKNFDVDQEHIVVGNGAAELIKAIIEESEGNINFIAEFYLQIAEKYKKDYKNALIMLKEARQIFLIYF